MYDTVSFLCMIRSGLALVLVLAACSRLPRPEGTTPAASDGAPPTLPPVPLVNGPLAIRVQQPPANALIESRDSNFVSGSLGSGRATLTINGVPVRVLPNGSFLAFIANPPADSPRYELVASLGIDTVRLTHPVRLLPPRPVLALDGPLVVDSASLTPPAGLVLREDERVRVSVRAPANIQGWVR